jgi:sugar/nucleoside kinase (ribokinase family)
MSLLVIGTVAFDAIETPFGKTDKIIGGAATYISVSASYFRNKINLVSVVGEDFPQATIDMLSNKGINTEGLQIKQGEKTFFWSHVKHIINTASSCQQQPSPLAIYCRKSV